MFFVERTYHLFSKKLTSPLTILVLSDLHGRTYPEGEGDLLGACARKSPDLILIPGDTVTAREEAAYLPTQQFLCDLARLAPVYLANGNHESKLRFLKYRFKNRYALYLSALRRGGIRILNNKCEDICLKNNALHLAGLEVPLSAYYKWRRPRIPDDGICRALGRPDPERFNILLAHNPVFAEQYFAWGADLAVSGHYHGGIVRSPFSGRALMDPYGFPLPRYGYGQYEKDGRQLVVSGGLGDHFILPRIFNPRELLVIRAMPGEAVREI